MMGGGVCPGGEGVEGIVQFYHKMKEGVYSIGGGRKPDSKRVLGKLSSSLSHTYTYDSSCSKHFHLFPAPVPHRGGYL